MDAFCYLGSMVSYVNVNIVRRINLAQIAFGSMNGIRRENKLRLFKSNVKIVLLYRAETCVNEGCSHSLIVCLRFMCNIFWPKELRKLTGLANEETTIKKGNGYGLDNL